MHRLKMRLVSACSTLLRNLARPLRDPPGVIVVRAIVASASTFSSSSSLLSLAERDEDKEGEDEALSLQLATMVSKASSASWSIVL